MVLNLNYVISQLLLLYIINPLIKTKIWKFLKKSVHKHIVINEDYYARELKDLKNRIDKKY